MYALYYAFLVAQRIRGEGPFQMPRGRLPCLPQTISITIVDDTLIEPREVFTVTLSSPSGATLNAAASTGTVTIIDNDVSGSFNSVVCV